jgi:hypothetical protein
VVLRRSALLAQRVLLDRSVQGFFRVARPGQAEVHGPDAAELEEVQRDLRRARAARPETEGDGVQRLQQQRARPILDALPDRRSPCMQGWLEARVMESSVRHGHPVDTGSSGGLVIG